MCEKELAREVQRLAPKLKWLLLTHDDFVSISDHGKWREFLNVDRVAHEEDSEGLEMELKGDGPWKAGLKINQSDSVKDLIEVGDFEVYKMPGHSKGSLFYVHRSLSVVFTGDSFASFWGGPTGFPEHCHFDLRLQAASLRGFLQVAFSRHVFPSHGEPMCFENEAQRAKAFEVAAQQLAARARL